MIFCMVLGNWYDGPTILPPPALHSTLAVGLAPGWLEKEASNFPPRNCFCSSAAITSPVTGEVPAAWLLAPTL